jgi:hypothetical protein
MKFVEYSRVAENGCGSRFNKKIYIKKTARAKNIYIRSERLTYSCRATWSEKADL